MITIANSRNGLAATLPRTFRTSGEVVDRRTHGPVAGLRIEAWDKAGICRDLVAAVTSQSDGSFQMVIDESLLEQLFLDRRPLLFFRVFQITPLVTHLVASTDTTAVWPVRGPQTVFRIEVDLQAQPAMPPVTPTLFVVRGQVLDATTGPLSGKFVRAFDKNFGLPDKQIGQAVTDAGGNYAITYDPAQLGRAGKSRADLLVQVFAAVSGPAPSIASSDTNFQAPTTLTLDLIVGGTTFLGQSDYVTLISQVRPALNGATPDKLTDADSLFIGQSLGLESQRVASLADTHRLALGINALAQGINITPDVAHAFTRAGLPTNPRALLSRPPNALRKALDDAVRSNIIPMRTPAQIDAVMTQLQQATVGLASQPPDPTTTTTLSALLNTVLPAGRPGTPSLQTAFLIQYVQHQGPIDQFWQKLATQPAFQPALIDQIQFTLQLGALTRHHLPLVQAIQKLRAGRKVNTLRDLAKFDETDWTTVLNQPGVGVPTTVPGADAASKTRNYAAVLTRTIETAFPTAVIANRIGRDQVLTNPDVTTFFNNNPNFGFDTHRVTDYLAKTPNALAGVADPVTLTTRLKGMSRLFKLTPRYSEMSTLMADGLHSAQGIVRMGRRSFVERYGPQFGSNERAEAIHDNACWVASASLALASKYHSSFNDVSAYVLPGLASAQAMSGPQVADWPTLFGSLDFCACEHCRSVYSPAAYLVDLLQFLDKYPSNVPAIVARSRFNIFLGKLAPLAIPHKSARDILLTRRPDIAQIELTCENAETPLPYVDLVNEILEHVVAQKPFPSHIATSGAAAELSAVPESMPDDASVRKPAYDTLAAQVYPWQLPFDLWAAEARVYLEHLGAPRYQLMETLPHVPPIAAKELAYEVAAEHLGLSPLSRQIITGTAPPQQKQPWLFWGLTQNSNSVPDPSNSNKTIQVDWLSVLGNAQRFLQRSGLSYDELLELCGTRYLNQATPLTIAGNTPDTCEVAKLDLTGITAAALDCIQRFLRLRHALGWTLNDLDKASAALKAPAAGPDDDFLLKLSQIERLRADLRIPLDQMLSWWSTIDTGKASTAGTSSLYDRLFLNKAVKNPVDQFFALNAARDELADTTQSITAHAATILAALRIGAAELSLLTDSAVSQETLNLPSEISNDKLNLANLSQLHRLVSFARALKLSLSDVLSLKALTGINPFDPNDLSQARLFVGQARRMRASHFRLAEVDYLLRHVSKPASGIAPEQKRVVLILDEIANELAKLVPQPAVEDPNGELTSQQLRAALPADQVPIAVGVIDGTSPLADAARADFIDRWLAAFLGATEAKSKLIGPGALPEKADRFSYVLPPLTDYLRRTGLIKQKLGEALKLEAATIDTLLSQVLVAQVDLNKKALADFMPMSASESAVYLALDDAGRAAADVARQQRQLTTYLRLQKAAMIISRLKIASDELSWLVAHNQKGAWLDFNVLPLTLATSGQPLFDAWARLVDLFRLRDSLPGSALFDLFHMAATQTDEQGAALTPDTYLARVSDRTGWTIDDLKILAGANGFNLAFPVDHLDEQGLLRLKGGFDLLKRLGAPATKVLLWAGATVTDVDASNIKNTVKSKYNDDAWPTVAKPLQDVLRDKQRAALVAYLLWQRGYKDSDELFDNFLVDVEMSPCQMTSRIVQANSAVQLFVQRCLLNLEPSVQLDKEAAAEWKWMKNYRVWEANRKVFLYPENWIEPELRDDKTPFFKALENQLLQSDVNNDTAEDAFHHYLEKFDQVARLEMVGMYHQKKDGKDDHDVLHVFGRTSGTPHVYFYRTRIDNAHWTPWEKVDLDIKGDHLIPVVWNRRLHLFWPVISEVADEDQSDNMAKPDSAGAPATKHLEIQLAWSEYKHGKWLAKKLTSGEPVTSTVPVLSQQLSFEPLGSDSGEPVDPASGRADDLMIRVIGRNSFDWQGSTIVGNFLFGFFRFTSCGGKGLTTSLIGSRWGDFPAHWGHTSLGTSIDRMDLVEIPGGSGGNGLYLVTGSSSFADDFAAGQRSVDEMLEKTEDTKILGTTPGTFRLVQSHQYKHFVTQDSLFFEDDTRTFLVSPHIDSTVEWNSASKVYPNIHALIGGDESDAAFQPARKWAFTASTAPYFPTYAYSFTTRYRFQMFYHPHVCDFIRQLNRYGLTGLFDWSKQKPTLQLDSRKFFDTDYSPVASVVPQPYPVEDVDFSHRGAYAQYNWEVFFHAPLLVATRLSENQRFAEAQQWFHAIFDPTSGATLDATAANFVPVPQCFWRVRPFFENTSLQPIEELLQNLGPKTPPAGVLQALQSNNDQDDGTIDLATQIDRWRQNPFNPHLIARMRPIAYQKTVVMKYIDNLIAWGDQLFRQDTIESINEATQLYILAGKILGPRPQQIPARKPVVAKTYSELEPLLDDFSNAHIEIEHWVPRFPTLVAVNGLNDPGPVVIPTPLYFCIPANDKLLSYWDTVADRLFKIRHCMNIEGVVRQLPLFEPPIDPALLVRATAAGIDLSSLLSDLHAPIPLYRFSVMLQKANDLSSEVKSLGAALLSALEKRDAEGLSLLRSTQEIAVLQAVQQIKEQQVTEAQAALDGLNKAWAHADKNFQYYSSRPFMNLAELAHASLSLQASLLQAAIEGAMIGASSSHMVPTATAGGAGMASAVAVSTTVSGNDTGNSAEAAAKAMNIAVTLMREGAALNATLGGYLQRADDRGHQADLAAIEKEQIQKQIDAASAWLTIATLERDNHATQVQNAQDVDTYMRDKFTNQELYDWTVSQIAAVYFQTYQLAYDLAKRAEKTFQFERGVASSNFIKFGYWDSLKKGLLAGERLSLDLKRMEMAYLDQNRREYEITKHVSLMLIDPLALIALKETGQCEVSLPEALFDADYPGHYMRRLKSASLTIPCVVGPYTSINCTLTLLSNKTRIKPVPSDPYEENPDGEDNRFVTNFAPMQSIATSHAQNDSGLFELNFRDERYLPFEGAGVISRWRIDLPKDSNAFDFDTLTDVVLHVKYNAREGGENLKKDAKNALEAIFKGAQSAPLARLFSLKHEFPTDWYRFLHPNDPSPGADIVHSITIDLSRERFPFQFRGKTLTINSVRLFLKMREGFPYDDQTNALTVHLNNDKGFGFVVAGSPVSGLPAASPAIGPTDVPTQFMLVAQEAELPKSAASLTSWWETVSINGSNHLRLNANAIEDIWIVCNYLVTTS